MDANPPSDSTADAIPSFEGELCELILAAYGRGTPVENTWEIDSGISDAPNWRVIIEKVPPAEREYTPSLLEE